MKQRAAKLAVFGGVVCFAIVSQGEAGPLMPYEQMILNDHPVAYYRFEEQPGATQAADSSGNNHHGAYNGNATTGPSVPGLFLGRALQLDGNGDYVRVANTVLNGSSGVSIEAWIYPDRLYDWDALVNQEEWWPPGVVHFQFNDGQKLAFAVRDTVNTTFNYGFNEDQWYHVVVTYDATTGSGGLFVNGSLAESFSGSTTSLLLGPFWIGGWAGGDGSRFFEGKIDEVAIYNYVLTGGQVQDHYLAAVPEPMSIQLAAAGLLALCASWGLRKCRKFSTIFRRSPPNF